MGYFNSRAGAIAMGAGAAFAIFAAIVTPADAAKKAPAPGQPLDEAAQKQKDAAAARANYENGVKQYQSGKYQQASDDLSAALRVGGLPGPDMAKALYYRGLAYKKQSKPGLAISDLTSALWLKDGLNDADRKAATAERAEAYRMAGLGDGNAGSESVAVADPNSGAAAPAPAVPAAAPPAGAAKPSGKSKGSAAIPAPIPPNAPVQEITRQSPDSEAAQDAARARKLAAAPIDAGGLQTAASATVVGGGPAPAKDPAPAAEAVPPAAVPAPAPVASIAAASSPDAPVLSAAPIDSAPPAGAKPADGSSIGGFFSNLFSGGAKPQADTTPPMTTASTTPPQTSSWSEQTSVASGSAKPASASKAVKQAVAVPGAAAASPTVKGGKYKIHIAAVRSRQEAEAIAQKLQAQSGTALKSRAPVVDEAVIGSMGTFYRVRVGSYATAEEPRGVCNALRSSGFDCLVVTN
jgi:tetratricopeptide (TPR) repeat protein